MIKTCSVCEELKPLTDFYKSRGRPYAHCKTCHREKTRANYDKTKAREYARKRRARLKEQG